MFRVNPCRRGREYKVNSCVLKGAIDRNLITSMLVDVAKMHLAFKLSVRITVRRHISGTNIHTAAQLIWMLGIYCIHVGPAHGGANDRHSLKIVCKEFKGRFAAC